MRNIPIYPVVILVFSILLQPSGCATRTAYLTKKPTIDMTRNSLYKLCSRIIDYRATKGDFPESSEVIQLKLSIGILNYLVIRTDYDKPSPFIFISNSHPYFQGGLLPAGLFYLKCFLENEGKPDNIGFSLVYVWGHNQSLFPKPLYGFGTNYDCFNWHKLVENRANPKIPNSVFFPDGEEDPVLFKFDYFTNYPYTEPDKIYWVWS